MATRTKCLDFESNWVVALAAFWVNFCVLGVLRSNSVVYSALMDVFEVDRKTASWPIGIMGFFMCITGALSGIVSHCVSLRTLAVAGCALASAAVSLCSCAPDIQYVLLLYGAVQGVGIGILVPLTHVVLNQNFIKYRAFALGVAYSGSSAGSFVFPPLAHSLYWHFGLHGMFLLLGGIMLNSLIGAILFRSPKTDKVSATCTSVQKVLTLENAIGQNAMSHQSPELDKENDRRDNTREVGLSGNGTKISSDHPIAEKRKSATSLATDVLTSPAFFVVSAAYAIFFSMSAIFLMVIVDFAEEKGVPADRGVYLVSAFSAGDLAGRLGCGWLADLQCLQRRHLVRAQLLAMGTLCASLGLCPAGALAPAAVALGLLNGGVIVNHSVLLTEYLGLARLPLAMGFSTCLVGLTALLRPMVVGIFRDQDKKYDQLFVFLGSLQIAVTALWSIDIVIKKIPRTWFHFSSITSPTPFTTRNS